MDTGLARYGFPCTIAFKGKPGPGPPLLSFVIVVSYPVAFFVAAGITCILLACGIGVHLFGWEDNVCESSNWFINACIFMILCGGSRNGSCGYAVTSRVSRQRMVVAFACSGVGAPGGSASTAMWADTVVFFTFLMAGIFVTGVRTWGLFVFWFGRIGIGTSDSSATAPNDVVDAFHLAFPYDAELVLV